MTLISYAPNSVDIPLWRLFKKRKTGFFIDMAVASDRQGSLTRLLYDQGWRGVVLTDKPYAPEEYGEKREQDVHVSFPLKPRVQGYNKVRVKYPAFASLCEEHLIEELHLVVVDGCHLSDFQIDDQALKQYRPWVMVIVGAEAVFPRDDGTLFGDYSLQYSDGQHNILVRSDLEHLKPPKPLLPPNDSDEFITSAEMQLRDRVESLEESAESASVQIESLEEELFVSSRLLQQLSLQNSLLNGRLSKMAHSPGCLQGVNDDDEEDSEQDEDEDRGRSLARLRTQISGMEQELFESNRYNTALNIEVQRMKQQIRDIFNSRSWRITKPLRISTSFLRRCVRKLRREMMK